MIPPDHTPILTSSENENAHAGLPRRGRATAAKRPMGAPGAIMTREQDRFWYKDAIIYEVHVRAFLDSNGDGIGDFGGLAQKLEYLRDLGVTAIWLLPFYPSPLKDDGYDIADYYSINPIYGALKDFKVFLQKAHDLGLRVITELVVNHTSDQHPWFQRSRRAPRGSTWRDFYVWSDTSDKYRDARIIFRDFENSNWTWDPVANAYFWHRFYSHQPDLNFECPRVHRELQRVLDFWLDMGVDGLRLDAVPYLYEREGTSCENLKETHSYLKTLRKHVDEKYGNRMLLAEANQWPEDAVSYFGEGTGDECHMAFHFPLMPRIFMAVRMEDRVPIVDILGQTPALPASGQWALFLRNHDELTLEMVTDEERDYMYRVYANDTKARINLGIRRRLSPLLGNDRKRIELLHLLLFSLPGTPVLYYGDEIGMGDNIYLGDRNGVRTPMQWSSDRNAGFSRASPQALYLPVTLDPEYHYEAVNVDAQQRNPHSLLWWMKRAMALRKRHPAFGRGSLKLLQPNNRKILAFLRSHEDEAILVVANLSRFPQPVLLDLSEFKNRIPVELFGSVRFPMITGDPYLLTLSPHAMFWFSLESAPGRYQVDLSERCPEVLVFERTWNEFLESHTRSGLEDCVANYLQTRAWFGTRGQRLKGVQINEAIPVAIDSIRDYLLLLTADYVEGDPEQYFLPVGFATGEERQRLEQTAPQSIIARFRSADESATGVLYDASTTRAVAQVLMESITRRRSLPAPGGELRATVTPVLRSHGLQSPGGLDPTTVSADQGETTIVYGTRLFLKLFRRVEHSVNPELEVNRFLTERGFAHMPRLAGALTYRRHNGQEFTAGILSEYSNDWRNTFTYTADMLSRYFDRVRAMATDEIVSIAPPATVLTDVPDELPQKVLALLGTYVELARLLGQRTGELHVALAADRDHPAFAPEPFTPFYQRSLLQSMRNLVVHRFQVLRNSLGRLPEPLREQAEVVLGLENRILDRLKPVHTHRITAKRIRCHGDLHLGETLFTGKDFLFRNFEGVPSRPFGERRIKRSPIRDVASLIRSFDYVTHAALLKQLELGTLQDKDLPAIDPWKRFWSGWVTALFVKAYLKVVSATDLLPPSREQLEVLLDAQLLEQLVYETAYELDNRPDWLVVPWSALLQMMALPAPPR